VNLGVVDLVVVFLISSWPSFAIPPAADCPVRAGNNLAFLCFFVPWDLGYIL